MRTAGCTRSSSRRSTRISAVIGAERDPVQAYCDVLEHKWLLSEAAGRDVGLESAIASYVKLGAPAPEEPGTAVALDAEDPVALEAEDPAAAS